MRHVVWIALAACLLSSCGASEGELISLAQKSVQAKLKDPESAKFGDTYLRPHPEESPKYQKVQFACGSVNAKNSFGGYSGSVRFVVLLGIPNGEKTYEILHVQIEPKPEDSAFQSFFWDNDCKS